MAEGSVEVWKEYVFIYIILIVYMYFIRRLIIEIMYITNIII
jgi:hypothetical protein